MSNIQFVPTLTHSVNNSGRMGFFVDPHGCSCDGCHDYLAENTGIAEPPGFSHLPPRPSSLRLERQTAAPHNSTEGSPVFSPLSHTSSSAPLPLPQRSNGGGIAPPVALGPTPTGLGNWRAQFEGFRESRWDEQEEENFAFGEEDLRIEIVDHLTEYLTMLEKHQKVMAAKLDLYAFLLEDASVRLRLDAFNKKINSLKATLEKLE